jgi:hypothetical protein
VIHELLRTIAASCDELGIRYMVVGSFASTAHGVPRSTQDLDLVIDPTADQLEHLLARFEPEAFYVDAEVARDALRRRSMFNVIDMRSGWKIDLVIRKARRFSVEELARRQITSILGVDVAAASAEDTIIAKLEWAKEGRSERQLDDVAGILRVRAATRWVTELELGDEWRRARER